MLVDDGTIAEGEQEEQLEALEELLDEAAEPEDDAVEELLETVAVAESGDSTAAAVEELLDAAAEPDNEVLALLEEATES